jgi:hypothetical protein
MANLMARLAGRANAPRVAFKTVGSMAAHTAPPIAPIVPPIAAPINAPGRPPTSTPVAPHMAIPPMAPKMKPETPATTRRNTFRLSFEGPFHREGRDANFRSRDFDAGTLTSFLGMLGVAARADQSVGRGLALVLAPAPGRLNETGLELKHLIMISLGSASWKSLRVAGM